MRFTVAHQIEGRTRLRACDRPPDSAALAAFAERFSRQSGIERLDLRETTASLVIEHPTLDAPQLAESIAHAGGEIVAASSVPRDNLAAVRNGIGEVDTTLSRLTEGVVDMRTLSFLVLFTLGITQLLRGRIMMPAFSFLMYAFQLVRDDPGGLQEPGSGE